MRPDTLSKLKLYTLNNPVLKGLRICTSCITKKSRINGAFTIKKNLVLESLHVPWVKKFDHDIFPFLDLQ